MASLQASCRAQTRSTVQAASASRASRAQAGAAASLGRPTEVQRQGARNVLAQRRGIAASKAGAARTRSAALSVVAKAGGDVLVVGSSGQTAARVIVNLLRSGFKVTAGVDTDPDEAAEVVKFAKKLDILGSKEASGLKLAEFNPLDAESIAGVLKKGMRVVLVVGDQAGSRRPDLRLYDAVVDALLELSGRIGQLVLVTPMGGGSTQLFGRGGGSSNGRLSPLECKVVDSGVDYLIVRAAPCDRVTDRYADEANIVVGPPGGLPSGLQASRSQVAAVVAKAMSQAQGNAVIEVGASPAAPAADVSRQVAAALAGGMQLAEAEEEEEEEEVEEAPAKKGMFGGFGTRKIVARPAAAAEEEEEEEEEEAAPAKKSMFGGFGTRKIVAKPAAAVEEEEEEEEEEAPAPAKKSMFGGFGTRKVVAKPAAAAAVEEEEEVEEAPAKAAPARNGFFTIGGSKKAQQPEAAAEEEEEAAAPAPKKAFAFGTSSSRRPQAASAVEEEEDEAPARPARIVRGRKPMAAVAEEKQAAPARQAVAVAAKGDAPPQKKGFLGFLGISNETVFVDE